MNKIITLFLIFFSFKLLAETNELKVLKLIEHIERSYSDQDVVDKIAKLKEYFDLNSYKKFQPRDNNKFLLEDFGITVNLEN